MRCGSRVGSVGICATLLPFREVGGPVGGDRVRYLGMERGVGRRFNQIYCGVDEHAEEHDHVKLGGVFPVPKADVGAVGRLVGIDGKNKMSKSLGNAIFISDPAKEVEKKVMKIFTGRQSPTEPGDVTNALFQYGEAVNPIGARLAGREGPSS